MCIYIYIYMYSWASQVMLVVKNLPANAGAMDAGSITGSGRSPGGAHGNPLQYSYLENPMDRGAWQATVHVIAESEITEQQAQHSVCTVKRHSSLLPSFRKEKNLGRKNNMGTSLVVQWLKLLSFHCRGHLLPGQGAKILHAAQCS